jgi:hypothetical protein
VYPGQGGSIVLNNGGGDRSQTATGMQTTMSTLLATHQLVPMPPN